VNRLILDDVAQRRLDTLLPAQAVAQGDATWLISGDDRLSFAAGHDLVERYAAGFHSQGVGRGDVVAVLMDSCIDYVLVVLALIRVGAVHVPVNTAFRGAFLGRLLEHAEPRCVVVDEPYVEQLLSATPDGLKPLLVVRGDEAAAEGPFTVTALSTLAAPGNCAPSVDTRHDDVAAITYTSGTTGRSKGVIQTHHYWLTATEAMSSGRDIREGDVFYSCTPMFHAGAWLLNIYPSLLYGLPLGIDSWFSVTDFWSSVRRYGATQLFTLGAMHMWLWGQPPGPDDAANPARIWTAVPLAGDLVEPFTGRFGLEGVFSAYGQTEIMPAAIADVRRRWKPGSAGIAQPHLELQVVDDLDRVVAPGEVGELVCRPKTPDSMFSGYFKMPDETLRAFRNLWYHTGDLARIDADGELFFVDRKADYLRRRGENISSLEVEEAIRDHPDVAVVAVYGVPAGVSQDEIKASVVTADGAVLDPPALAAYCSENLPYFAVPRYIELIEALPRTPTGRVQKFLLRDAGVTDQTWDAVAAGFTAATRHGRGRRP
jgi:crotonobetaine/carnitine-CoA ligase